MRAINTVMGHSLRLTVLAQKISGNSFNHSGWWPFKYPVPERHLLCTAQTATENPRKETKTRVREHIILSSLDSQGLTTNPYAILQKKIAYSFFFFHISSAKNILWINRLGPLLPRLSSQLHTPSTAPGALGYREEPRPRTTCPSTAPHMGHCCSCHRLRSSLLKLLPSKLPSHPQHMGVLSWSQRHKAEQSMMHTDLSEGLFSPSLHQKPLNALL